MFCSMEYQKVQPNEKSQGQNNERKRPQSAGAGRDSAPAGTVDPDFHRFYTCKKQPCRVGRSSLC